MRITPSFRTILGPVTLATALLAIITFVPQSKTPATTTSSPDATVAAGSTSAADQEPMADPTSTQSSDPLASSGVQPPAGPPSIDAQVADEITRSGTSTAVITMRTTSSGDDASRITANTSAYEELLASLPAGSFSEPVAPGTVPVATMSINALALEALRTDPHIAAVEANIVLRSSSIASSTVVGTQRAVADGWSGSGETVAIVDTGVNTTHPYLMNGATPKTIGEACFSTTSSVTLSSCPGGVPMNLSDASRVGWGQPCDMAVSVGCGHGTSVAGVAVGGTGIGTPTGAAPGASIVAVKVFSYDSSNPAKVGASLSDVNLGLQWLYLHRNQFPDLAAVNLSLGAGKFTVNCGTSSIQAYIHQLANVGIATVVAAGNDGYNDALSLPACAPDAVAVAALDDVTAARAAFSNLSDKVALYAPGVSITTSLATGGLAGVSGTSFAAPTVAGTWAVLRQRFPAMSVAEALDHLRTMGTGVTTDTSVGRYIIPLVRADRAMEPPATSASVPPTNLTTVTPARLMDTRSEPTIDGLASSTGALGGGEVRRVRVTGRGYVPSDGVTSISVNITVADPTASGFLTVFGGDGPRPNASTLNFTPGGLASNMAIVPVNGDGTIAIFNSSGSSAVIVDVLGWFPSAGDLRALPPARLMDTRSSPTIDGRYSGTGAFGPGESRTLPVTGRGGVPSSGARAVAINLTVAGSTTSGYLSVHPTGTPRPTASNLNFGPGQIVANTVIVPVDSLGRIQLFASAGRTDIVVDVIGWFPRSPTATPLTPARLLDTRPLPTVDGRFSGIGALGNGGRLNLTVTGRGGVPAHGVVAVAINLTVDHPSANGFITVFPSLTTLPGTSSINFIAGVTLANATIVPVGADGRITLFNQQGSTNVIVDVLAWFG